MTTALCPLFYHNRFRTAGFRTLDYRILSSSHGWIFTKIHLNRNMKLTLDIKPYGLNNQENKPKVSQINCTPVKSNEE